MRVVPPNKKTESRKKQDKCEGVGVMEEIEGVKEGAKKEEDDGEGGGGELGVRGSVVCLLSL